VYLEVTIFRATFLLLGVLSRRFALIILAITASSLLIYQSLSSKEVANQPSLFHHVLGYRANDTDNPSQESLHRVILEEDITSKKFSKDAAKGPHIYLVVIPASQDDLRGTVGA